APRRGPLASGRPPTPRRPRAARDRAPHSAGRRRPAPRGAPSPLAALARASAGPRAKTPRPERALAQSPRAARLPSPAPRAWSLVAASADPSSAPVPPARGGRKPKAAAGVRRFALEATGSWVVRRCNLSSAGGAPAIYLVHVERE